MISNKLHHFRILDSKKTTYKISRLFEYNNPVINDKILNMYKLHGPNMCVHDFKFLEEIVDKNYSKCINKLKATCINLDAKWSAYREEYLHCLKELKILFKENSVYMMSCYLGLLPNNEIDFSDNTIYLNITQTEDEIFKTFIIMLTKIIILDFWKNSNNWGWDYSYKTENKIWLFVEIAIDAIFANTTLSKISNKASYKYFYNVKINGVCFMDKFRELYNKVPLIDFLNSVFIFVTENYLHLIKFKDYLYQ